MAAYGGFPDWLRPLGPGEREQLAAAPDWEDTAREAGAGGSGMLPAPWQDFDAWLAGGLAGAPDPGPLTVESEDPEDPCGPSVLPDPWEGFDPDALVDPDPTALSVPAGLFGPADASALATTAAQYGPGVEPAPAQGPGLWSGPGR